MRTFAKLFAKSPFAPLQKHMQDVNGCVIKIKEIFEALENGDNKSVAKIAKEISKQEARAGAQTPPRDGNEPARDTEDA